MSIEKLIEENTATAKELIAAMNTLSAAIINKLAFGDAAVGEQVKSTDKKADTKKSTAETASSAKGAGQAASEKVDNAKEKPAATAADTESLYLQVKQPFLDLIASDRPAAVTILEQIGVKALKAADHAQLLKAKELLGIKDEAEEELS